jgi:hypothetical protein
MGICGPDPEYTIRGRAKVRDRSRKLDEMQKIVPGLASKELSTGAQDYDCGEPYRLLNLHLPKKQPEPKLKQHKMHGILRTQNA